VLGFKLHHIASHYTFHLTRIHIKPLPRIHQHLVFLTTRREQLSDHSLSRMSYPKTDHSPLTCSCVFEIKSPVHLSDPISSLFYLLSPHFSSYFYSVCAVTFPLTVTPKMINAQDTTLIVQAAIKNLSTNGVFYFGIPVAMEVLHLQHVFIVQISPLITFYFYNCMSPSWYNGTIRKMIDRRLTTLLPLSLLPSLFLSIIASLFLSSPIFLLCPLHFLSPLSFPSPYFVSAS
jgi:hypothetical protein